MARFPFLANTKAIAFRRTGVATSTSRARRAEDRRAAITQRRSCLMDEIARLASARDAPAEFLDKARALLTRHWGKATWSARERLLTTAAWLIEVDRLHASAPAHQATYER